MANFDAQIRESQEQVAEARQRMQGTLTGKHSSPDKGQSVEFAEHREYYPGDDPRNLDWKVMAKNDKTVIKQYIEETNLRVTLAVDVSGSMKYQGDLAAEIDGTPRSKFDYARYLAAALSYIFINQGDGVGMVTFDQEVRKLIRNGSQPSHVRRILEELWNTSPGGESQIADVLHAVAEQIPRRGLVILISDLLGDKKSLIEALHHFGHRNNELVVFHVMAEEELTFPFQSFHQFKDLEGKQELMRIDPKAVKAAYLDQLNDFIESVEATCGALHADYVPVTTKMPLQDTLIQYFARRSHAS